MDFLPWLKPFMSKELKEMKGKSEEVRSFVEASIIEPKRHSKERNRRSSADFLDGLMDYIDEAGIDEVRAVSFSKLLQLLPTDLNSQLKPPEYSSFSRCLIAIVVACRILASR